MEQPAEKITQNLLLMVIKQLEDINTDMNVISHKIKDGSNVIAGEKPEKEGCFFCNNERPYGAERALVWDETNNSWAFFIDYCDPNGYIELKCCPNCGKTLLLKSK